MIFLPSKYIYALHEDRSTEKEAWYISGTIKHEHKVIVSYKDSVCVYVCVQLVFIIL